MLIIPVTQFKVRFSRRIALLQLQSTLIFVKFHVCAQDKWGDLKAADGVCSANKALGGPCRFCESFRARRMLCSTGCHETCLHTSPQGHQWYDSRLLLQAYVDAPNQASGPLPEGFKTNIFKGPYYEWWTAKQVTGSFPNPFEALRRVLS